jgi:glycosyltransferase involved in cell wall biosynthesis
LKTAHNILEVSNTKTDFGPLVSVVIPFYNDFKYLNEALESCFENTYQNIEVVIVDDCSSRPLTLADLKVKNDRFPIRIHRNESNRGPGYSRNVGIQIARGDFIAFLDADDLWRPAIIEKQMKTFLEYPNIVWVYTDGNYLVDDKFHRKPNSAFHGFPDGRFPSGEEVNAYHLQGHNYLTFSSNMFRKSALMEIGLFDESLKVSEDWDLFVRMAERFRHGVKAINESLMIYRVNNKGRHFVNRADYVEVNVKILEGMYQRQGLLETQRPAFERAVAMIYQRAGIQRLNAGHHPEARVFLFHPRCRPLNFQLRMIVLRALSWLPTIFYKTTLKIYDRI